MANYKKFTNRYMEKLGILNSTETSRDVAHDIKPHNKITDRK